MKTINELCDIVRETAYAIHVYHGHGHLEKAYENVLAHRLRKDGIEVKQQHPIKVLDEEGMTRHPPSVMPCLSSRSCKPRSTSNAAAASSRPTGLMPPCASS